jgi:hypothetical protein
MLLAFVGKKDTHRQEEEMPVRTTYHVTPEPSGGWRVLKAGGQRASARAALKSAAVQKARELAKKQPLGQVVVHKEDGTIQTEYTYGDDPARTRG